MKKMYTSDVYRLALLMRYHPRSTAKYFRKYPSSIAKKFLHQTNASIMLSRLKFQKHKLEKILPIVDMSLTEWDNMQLNNYNRIWDCGNNAYVWKKS